MQLGNQKVRNEVAYLPQQIQFRRRWNGLVFIFHPCRVAGLSKSFQLFFKFLWDGCETLITMKTTYSNITLRYVHDVVTGEFANIGVVLYAPEQRFLEARFATSYERLNAIFLKIDHLHFRALMRYMANRFEELGAEDRDCLNIRPVNSLSEIVKQVLPPDDSSLQWS